MDCPICHDDMNDKTGMATLGCSHSYHLRCLVMWILTNDTCPCCRTELNENEKISDIQHTEDEVAVAEFLGQLAEIEIIGNDEYEHFPVSSEVPILQSPPRIIRTPYIPGYSATRPMNYRQDE